MKLIRILSIALTLSVSACSNLPTNKSPATLKQQSTSTKNTENKSHAFIRTSQDSAPSISIDVSTLENPTPVQESLSRYGNHSPYTVLGETYSVLNNVENFSEKGIASWYGTKFHGRRTSSGEPYDMYKMTAAHKHLPLPSYVRVTHLENKKSIIVRVNDRGPFHDGRIIDLSYAAGKKLGIDSAGTGPVSIELLASPFTVTNANHDKIATIYLQAGAYSNKSNAERVLNHLAKHLEHNIYLDTSDSEPLLHRVRIGPIKTLTEAHAASNIIIQQGYENPALINKQSTP